MPPSARNGCFNPSTTAAASDIQITDEVVVLAAYENSIAPIMKQYGDQLSGKVLVNLTNPLNATFDDLALPPGTSSAEEMAKIAPAGARVVKAFNTNFACTLLSREAAGQPLDVLIVGDDASAKALLADLVQDGGMRPVDVGPLRRARQLEGLGLLHITSQQTHGTNWMSAVKFVG